jgi:hypothetical protein
MRNAGSEMAVAAPVVLVQVALVQAAQNSSWHCHLSRFGHIHVGLQFD